MRAASRGVIRMSRGRPGVRGIDPLKRLLDNVLPEPNTGCWLWTGGYKGDYGTIYVHRKNRRAHRAAWLLLRGPIPDGVLVCHKCDTPACVNPNHLFLGTPADNTLDSVKKGRHTRVPGEKHGCAILTEDEARAILASPERGVDLADRYGVSQSTISAIRVGRLWKHIDREELRIPESEVFGA